MGSTDRHRPLIIRNYQSSDWDAIYEICVLTGDRGGDASATFNDPLLVPQIFAGPYLYLEPELAFVLDDEGQAVGYVLGTSDTADFARAYREGWLPRLAEKYPTSPAGPPFSGRDDLFLHMMHRPERMLVPGVLENYPSHLHIDVIPAHQGQGWGRGLIEAFVGAAAGAGADGVHVSVDVRNEGAHLFYPRVGFSRLDVPDADGVVYYGRTIGGT